MSTAARSRAPRPRKARVPVGLGRGRRPQARKLREAKDALYQEHIVGIAERLFAEQGFTSTRMQDIASAGGISLAKLYEFHPSKEALYRNVVVSRDRQMLEQFLERWGDRLQAPDSLEEVLLLMETHLQFLLEHPDYLKLLLREGYAWYSRSAQPTSEEQQMFDRGIANISMVLAWGRGRGMFNPGKSPELERLILTTQQTRLANWVMGGMKAPHSEVIAQVQADFVRICCRPAWVEKLLAADGSGLNARTLTTLGRLREEMAH